MTRAILIRHGETEWNRVERFRGQADLPLNARGRRQAEALGLRLASYQPAAVYSSPLRRAVETAQIMTHGLSLPVQPLEGLRDIDYGSWQGLSPKQAAQRFPDLWRLWQESPERLRFPGGETLDEVRLRAYAALQEALVQHPGQATIAVVSHRVVCKLLLSTVLGLDSASFEQIGQDVAALNMVETRGENLVVSLLNDTCHLRSGAGLS